MLRTGPNSRTWLQQRHEPVQYLGFFALWIIDAGRNIGRSETLFSMGGIPLRILTTLLLIVSIGVGASFIPKAAKFDVIEEKLRQTTDQIDRGSEAAKPTPVVIPEATPGWGPWADATDTER
jgi:hypothetical protein